MYDVVVAGGGPAGLCAARAVASAGACVVVCEREAAFGIPTRTSGGSFVADIRALGVPAELYNVVRTVRFLGPTTSATVPLGPADVCVLDADGSLDPAALPALVAHVREGRADLAVGRRVPVSRGSWPWHARAGNAVLAAQLRRRGLRVRDIGPVRAFRRRELLALGVTDRAFGYPLELLVRAAAAGWRIVELEVAYRPRTEGTRSKVSGSVIGTLRAARDMAGVLRRGSGVRQEAP